METGVIHPIADLPACQIRERILDFEQVLARVPGAKFGNIEECPLKHSFAGSMYIREIFIPRDFLLTGRIHRHEHPIFILSGDVSFVEESLGPKRIKAPYYGVSPAGTKRALYTHEDTVIVTVHEVGEERDLETIEEMLAAWTFEEFEKGLQCTNMLKNG